MKKIAGFQMNQGCGGEDSWKGLGEERGIRGGSRGKKKASVNSLSRALEKKGGNFSRRGEKSQEKNGDRDEIAGEDCAQAISDE
jgi:hypothetical protein